MIDILLNLIIYYHSVRVNILQEDLPFNVYSEFSFGDEIKSFFTI